MRTFSGLQLYLLFTVLGLQHGGGEISASIPPRVLKTECRWDPFHPEVSLSSDGRKEGVPESIGRRKLHRGLLWAKYSFI